MSNDNPFTDPNQPQNPGQQQPPYQPAKKSNGVLIGCIIAAAFIPVMGICAGLLLPAVQAAREAARRMSCSNNMKQIGLGLRNYEATYGTLPPAFTVDAQGRPMHSWRTLILPFVEEQSLHARIDFSKRWDDPANQAVAETAVAVYSCPSTRLEPTMTTYVGIVDPRGIMSGSTPTQFGQIVDGIANTVMLLETDSGNAVHWMSPDDVDVQAYMNAGSARDSGGHIGGAHVLMADGAVIFITDSMDSGMREALLTKDGGETVDIGY